MSKERLERNFQDKLKDYSSSIDDNQLWMTIESRVPRKKKKRRLFFWLFFAMVATSSLVIGLKHPSDSLAQTESKSVAGNNANTSQLTTGPEDTQTTLELNGDNIINEKETLSEGVEYSSQQLVPSNSNKVLESDAAMSQTRKNIKTEIPVDEEHVRPLPIEKALIGNVPSIPNLMIKEVNRRFAEKISLDIQKEKDKKRSPEKKVLNSFLALNYYAGKMNFKQSNTNNTGDILNYGEAHFSHGLSIGYNRYFSSNLYGKITLSYDVSYNKYQDQIGFDTIVPSSLGEQILEYSEYGNGIIDTELGIPLVEGFFERSIVNLNTIKALSFGIGLGFSKSFGKWTIRLETDIQRSIYFNINGLGRREDGKNIIYLNSTPDYFDFDAKYAVSGSCKVAWQMSKPISLTLGIQYQKGLNSVLSSTAMYVEKLDLIRPNVGLNLHL